MIQLCTMHIGFVVSVKIILKQASYYHLQGKSVDHNGRYFRFLGPPVCANILLAVPESRQIMNIFIHSIDYCKISPD